MNTAQQKQEAHLQEKPAGKRLEMHNISKSFGSVAVLDDVEFSVGPGEVVALLGSNGAGKSTLMKILTGVYLRDKGDIFINGHPVAFATPRQASLSGISFLPQEISVLPDMSVAENISIGVLPTVRAFGFAKVDIRGMRERASTILNELGFAHIDVDAFLADLSVAERRIVEIARALATDASILVMDEPTASLTEMEAAMIFRIIRRLKEKQTSIVYISHYLREVFEIADRIEVLRDGRNAGSFLPQETTVPVVVEAMLGAVSGNLFVLDRIEPKTKDVMFEAHGISKGTVLSNISLHIGKGEIVGVFGLVGSGVETLGRVIFGADGKPDSGKMVLDGQPYIPSSPGRGKASGIGFVTAERKKDGIIAELTVRENLVAPFLNRYAAGLFTSKAKETVQAGTWINTLSIKTNGPEQQIRTLSGGNQQKVCVARWLDPSVKMLILEEPTRGVDVGARRELYALLTDLAEKGLSILVLSSDVEEVAGLSDRSLVIDRGQIVSEFPRGTDAGQLMEATAGPKSPEKQQMEQVYDRSE